MARLVRKGFNVAVAAISIASLVLVVQLGYSYYNELQAVSSLSIDASYAGIRAEAEKYFAIFLLNVSNPAGAPIEIRSLNVRLYAGNNYIYAAFIDLSFEPILVKPFSSTLSSVKVRVPSYKLESVKGAEALTLSIEARVATPMITAYIHRVLTTR